jgi:hypothetical protein
LGGFAAIAFWAIVAKKLGFDIPALYDRFLYIRMDVSDLTCNIPKCLTLYSHSEILDRFPGKQEHYNAIMDKIPERTIIKWKNTPIEIMNTKNLFLSARDIKIFHVANLQPLLLYMLMNYIISNESPYYMGYKLGSEIVQWASHMYGKTKEKKYTDFLPTSKVYGISNISDSYILCHHRLACNLKLYNETPFDCSEFLTPKKIYPETIDDIKDKYYQFNPEHSLIYQFDGRKIANEKKTTGGHDSNQANDHPIQIMGGKEPRLNFRWRKTGGNICQMARYDIGIF